MILQDDLHTTLHFDSLLTIKTETSSCTIIYQKFVYFISWPLSNNSSSQMRISSGWQPGPEPWCHRDGRAQQLFMWLDLAIKSISGSGNLLIVSNFLVIPHLTQLLLKGSEESFHCKYCQAQPQPQLQLSWAENPQPPSHPPDHDSRSQGKHFL